MPPRGLGHIIQYHKDPLGQIELRDPKQSFGLRKCSAETFRLNTCLFQWDGWQSSSSAARPSSWSSPSSSPPSTSSPTGRGRRRSTTSASRRLRARYVGVIMMMMMRICLYVYMRIENILFLFVRSIKLHPILRYGIWRWLWMNGIEIEIELKRSSNQL